MRRFPCAFAVLLVVLFLSGCAMPLPVQVASLIADGISWFSTDKTLSDHAISLAANKDCSVWRGFSGDDICRDGAKDDATVMANASTDVEKAKKTDSAASGNQATVILETTSATTVTSSEESAQMMPLAVPQDEPAAVENGGLHFVLASFKVVDNARRLVDGNPLLSPTIVNVNVGNQTMHRVVVGPFMKEERKALARRIAKAGFKDAWIVRMDTNGRLRNNRHSNGQLASAFR